MTTISVVATVETDTIMAAATTTSAAMSPPFVATTAPRVL
jgi:hypothetical protein